MENYVARTAARSDTTTQTSATPVGALHVRGILLSFGCGLLLLPALVFWGVVWPWSTAIAVTAGLLLSFLRHRYPLLFDAKVGDPDPCVVAEQELMRARLSTTTTGTYF